MKQGESKNNIESEEEQVSSTEAMDEYFFDMLGSVADQQPLNKYSQDDDGQVNAEPVVQSVTPKLKLKTKVLAKAEFADRKDVKPVFAEPERARISPLIIPAAFPKLAPARTEPKVDVGEQRSQDTKVELKQKTETKLDRKTALAILEKKKSQLSAAQLSRLEEKLGVKSSVVSDIKPVAQVRTEVKPKPLDKADKVVAVPKVVEKSDIEVKSRSQVELKQSSVEAKEQKVESLEPVHEKKSALISPGEPGLVGPPVWAQDRFECLLFTVAGLKLAVPLVSLGAIYKIEKELTPIVGRADYFMGLYSHLDRNVRVLDTAKWVMPDRWSEKAREGYHFIIRLGGNNWGLACDSVHESIQLETDMVKWRSERTTRAWLSGTVIGHMCALLDADVLGLMLDEKASVQGTSFS